MAAPEFIYLNEQGGWRSWLLTTDHKRIGVLYLYSSLFFFLVGGLEALIIRMQLHGPNGTLVSADTYNQLFTMHGSVMMFLFAVPVIEAVGILLLPAMLGARDLPFPLDAGW